MDRAGDQHYYASQVIDVIDGVVASARASC